MKTTVEIADEILAWVATGRGVRGTIAAIIRDRDTDWRQLAHEDSQRQAGERAALVGLLGEAYCDAVNGAYRAPLSWIDLVAKVEGIAGPATPEAVNGAYRAPLAVGHLLPPVPADTTPVDLLEVAEAVKGWTKGYVTADETLRRVARMLGIGI